MSHIVRVYSRTNAIYRSICDRLSENLHSSLICRIFLKFVMLSTVYKEWIFQISVSSFGIIALDCRACNKIDLHSSYTENKLQAP